MSFTLMGSPENSDLTIITLGKCQFEIRTLPELIAAIEKRRLEIGWPIGEVDFLLSELRQHADYLDGTQRCIDLSVGGTTVSQGTRQLAEPADGERGV